jgi:hypothetical protein
VKGFLRAIGLMVVVILGLSLRLDAHRRLNVDRDEPIYLGVAFEYARYLQNGDYAGISRSRSNLEHPPLGKLPYSVILVQKQAEEPVWSRVTALKPVPERARPVFLATRRFAAIVGALQLLVVGLVSLPAALILALHTVHIHFHALATLEPLPGFFSLMAFFSGEMACQRLATGARDRRSYFLLGLSGLCWGLAAAAKYMYALSGIVLFFWLGLRLRQRLPALGMGALALLTFYAADPFLWPGPLTRLYESLTFHLAFSHGEAVNWFKFPWWQPFYWLTHSAPSGWAPAVYSTAWVDRLLLPVAVLGMPRLWRKSPPRVLWALTGLVFLLCWNTKWVHYILLILPPLALSAACTLELLVEKLQTLLKWSRSQRAETALSGSD